MIESERDHNQNGHDESRYCSVIVSDNYVLSNAISISTMTKSAKN